MATAHEHEREAFELLAKADASGSRDLMTAYSTTALAHFEAAKVMHREEETALAAEEWRRRGYDAIRFPGGVPRPGEKT